MKQTEKKLLLFFDILAWNKFCNIDQLQLCKKNSETNRVTFRPKFGTSGYFSGNLVSAKTAKLTELEWSPFHGQLVQDLDALMQGGTVPGTPYFKFWKVWLTQRAGNRCPEGTFSIFSRMKTLKNIVEHAGVLPERKHQKLSGLKNVSATFQLQLCKKISEQNRKKKLFFFDILAWNMFCSIYQQQLYARKTVKQTEKKFFCFMDIWHVTRLQLLSTAAKQKNETNRKKNVFLFWYFVMKHVLQHLSTAAMQEKQWSKPKNFFF